ncbi:MAG: hypothetical protein IJ165_05260 [Proteobacteria bacterium]|nr:hypothetical protein [Pseudomonadota bacterium]
MFELFAMSLREYWNEMNDGSSDVDQSIDELKSVLSEHYGKEISWTEPDELPSDDTEINVDVIDDRQLSSLHAIAAKLELDGNLDGLELDPEEPWESSVFDRLSEELEERDDENGLEKFAHLLSIGNSNECICLPMDLPFVAQINVDDDDEASHHHCDCGDDECCCEEDEGCIDIASSVAIRRELDDIAKALGLDPTLVIDEDTALSFDDEDPYRFARVGWYILRDQIDNAIKQDIPLIMRFCDDEEYDDLDDDQEEED